MNPTVAEAAIAIQIAAARDPLLVCGAGTKFGMLRPVQAADMISTAGLTGITLYAPKELIISARAGTPLHEIEATLAAHGQHLIAEPPDLSSLLATAPNTQTLGGVVATNLSGPRRVAWGAMRDHVMGVRAVTGRGEIIHSGGRVLKNVTGLDLCKLLTGSHGTLGVMTEITLKVLPAPEAVGTIVIPGLEAEKACGSVIGGTGFALRGLRRRLSACRSRVLVAGPHCTWRFTDADPDRGFRSVGRLPNRKAACGTRPFWCHHPGRCSIAKGVEQGARRSSAAGDDR